MKTYLLAFTLAFAVTAQAQILTLMDSAQFTNAQIWGVVSDQGDSLCVTTTFNPGTRPHIFLRKVDYSNIHSQSTPVQLTFDTDFDSITDMTDHKHIILNNEIYVSFSTQGDQALFLFKTDINGNRIGNIVTVTLGPGDPTNDMILTTDSTYIYVLHFDPPGQHHVYKYDTNLNFISSTATTTNAHNNIGGAIMHNGNFSMFTGSTFGFNSNLTLTEWTTNWAPVSTQNILSSSGGDGNWFASGMAHDPFTGYWMVGMSHVVPPTPINQEHIDILLYDAGFTLIDRMHITGDAHFRPHFAFAHGHLYVTYDAPGAVYMKKYYLLLGAVHEESADRLNVKYYPNPAVDQLFVSVENVNGKWTMEILDVAGRCVIEQSPEEDNVAEIDVSALAPGIYTLRLRNENGVVNRKIVVGR